MIDPEAFKLFAQTEGQQKSDAPQREMMLVTPLELAFQMMFPDVPVELLRLAYQTFNEIMTANVGPITALHKEIREIIAPHPRGIAMGALLAALLSEGHADEHYMTVQYAHNLSAKLCVFVALHKETLDKKAAEAAEAEKKPED